MNSRIKKDIFFSIIITFIKSSNNLIKCLENLNKQKFKNFEIILVSENYINLTNKFSKILKITKILIKNRYPGIKRHAATKIANGEYLVFIDDDAYPNENWLNEYYKNIAVENNFALGGPAIDEYKINTIAQKIFSFTYKVKYFGGFPERYLSLKEKIVDDWPTVNFCIKKKLYKKTKGLNYKFWPGEDSLLCNEIFYKFNYKIKYIPKALVYHARRLNFISHFKQLFGYGKMRGLFFINQIKNSFKLKFIIPSIFFLYNIFLITNYFILKNKLFYFFIPFCIYLMSNILLTTKTVIKIKEKKKMILFFFISNFINHNIYGIAFIFGIFSKKNYSKII
jgi:glycosyltransferase involved in cell wall biosynthesis